MGVRMAIVAALVGAQFVMMAVARVHPIRFYTWAPYDSQNEYAIEVVVGGRVLDPLEVNRRYHIAPRGVSPRSIYEVTSLAEYVESRYLAHEQARVAVTYRTNGRAEQTWRWPREASR